MSEMRKYLHFSGWFVLVIIMAAVLFFDSCKKDKGSNTTPPVPDPTYYFKYLDQKYELGKCIVLLDQNFGGPDKHLFHVYLTSQGVEYDSFHKRLTGVGNGVVFDLVTMSDTTFAGSSFAVHPEHVTPEVNDILNSRIMFNGDFSLMDGEITSISSGSCKVSKIDNICKFTLYFASATHDSITGVYAGNFELY